MWRAGELRMNVLSIKVERLSYMCGKEMKGYTLIKKKMFVMTFLGRGQHFLELGCCLLSILFRFFLAIVVLTWCHSPGEVSYSASAIAWKSHIICPSLRYLSSTQTVSDVWQKKAFCPVDWTMFWIVSVFHKNPATLLDLSDLLGLLWLELHAECLTQVTGWVLELSFETQIVAMIFQSN